MASKASIVWEKFLLTIDKVGLQNTAQLLDQHLHQHELLHHPDAEFVLDMVSKTFKVPVDEIRTGVNRKNDRRDAIGFCCYYLHVVFEYPMNQVGALLNKSEWVCYKYTKLIKKLHAGNHTDQKYLKWKKLFDAKVQEYQKTKPKDNG